jgi:protein-S-isoprenylcysteine O-methyltransferase Ste14
MSAQEEKVTVWLGGVGPKIALLTLPFLAAAIWLRLAFPQNSGLPVTFTARIIVAVVLAAVGLPFFITTAVVLLREHTAGRMAVTLTYRACRNPIYAAWIVFLIPAIAVLWNAWPLLAADAVLCVWVRLLVPREYAWMRARHGASWERYAEGRPHILPVGCWRR